MDRTLIFTLNRCIHWEKNCKGRYIGLQTPLFDLGTFFLPWVRNDGDRGFVEWFMFRFGWYPIPKANPSEVSAHERKLLSSMLK